MFDRLVTHNQHGISNLVLTNSSPKDNHSSLARLPRQLVQTSNVLNDIEQKPRVPEGVEIDDIANGTISKRRAEDGNIVLEKFIESVSDEVDLSNYFIGPIIDRLFVVDLFS